MTSERSAELTVTIAGIAAPDRPAATAARDLWDTASPSPGSLGRLEDIACWLAGAQGSCPPRPPDRPVAIVVAGDHGVAHAATISALPLSATAASLQDIARGDGPIAAIAATVGARLRVVDVRGPQPSAGDDSDGSAGGSENASATGAVDREDALPRAEVLRLIDRGAAALDDEVAAGADLVVVGDLGVGSSTIAAVVVGLLAPADAVAVIGRGSGIDDAAWMAKCAVVRDALRRGRGRRGDPVDLIAAVGGADVAALVGILLRAAYRRVPVILDGTLAAAAALIAHRLSHRARGWWLAGHLSTEPAHAIALERLDLLPVGRLDLRYGGATGGLLAVPAVVAAARALADLAQPRT